ncbi:alpha/beta fold hydrolase [Paenisporosarcina antarctica]|uniref:Alpha/beta hydrolase n=1 Tax=Paenisporosarcina antarctica TaxID=417367 RepID=A0A4P7A3P5_9BACL|nr:alpha/beta hydrolase [Paenisporosarcina antarctica]QBP42666.1 alpha/beta hydrolase [Paenisporosarcina antarctica]
MGNVMKRNNVQITGDGEKQIIFGHGFGCDQLVWNKVIKEFKHGYRVITFDYVGSGQSDKGAYSKDRYSTLDGYKQDLIDVCDSLGEGTSVFVGHSVSSMIGMLASIERPELFGKLVMIAPSPYYMNEPGYQGGFDKTDIDELLDLMEVNYKQWAKYLAPIIMLNEDQPELADNFEELLCSNDPQISREFAEVTFKTDVRAELKELLVPTLIMQPQYDAIVPNEVGHYIHTQIPESRLVVMKAKGHNPHISHAEETVAVIKEYLTKSGDCENG